MKILLDENIPIKLKKYFSDQHDVYTVSDMQWNSKKNGELLSLMIQEKFEGLVTIDKNLRYQQRIDNVNLALFVLEASNNKIQTLIPYIEKLNTIDTTKVIGVIEIRLS